MCTRCRLDEDNDNFNIQAHLAGLMHALHLTTIRTTSVILIGGKSEYIPRKWGFN